MLCLLYKSTEHVCFDFVYDVQWSFLKRLGNKKSLLLGGASR